MIRPGKPLPPDIRPDIEPAAPIDAGQDAEDVESFFDGRLEYALLRHAKKINEGNNGVILRLNLNELPEDLKNDLAKMGIEGESVAKIIKVYNPGKGKKEFEHQTRAYEIASSKAGDPKYAQVPRPYLLRDLPIDEETQNKIANQSSGFRADKRIEVMVMDYIPGEDLSTQLFKEVIRRHPKTVHLRDSVDDLNFAELNEEVVRALDFENPGGKARDEGERIHEQLKVRAKNSSKIFDFLLKDGAEIYPQVAEQIGNTIDLMHCDGFTIRDGHHRNFMIAGDMFVRPGAETQPPPRAYIIDFENAVEFPPGLSEDEIRDNYLRVADKEGRNFHDPRVPLRNIEPLTVPLRERRRQETEGPVLDLVRDLDSLEKMIGSRIQTNPALRADKFEASLRELLHRDDYGPADLSRLLAANPFKGFGSEKSFDAALLSLRRLLREEPQLKEAAARFCTSLEKIVPLPQWRRALSFLKTIK